MDYDHTDPDAPMDPDSPAKPRRRRSSGNAVIRSPERAVEGARSRLAAMIAGLPFTEEVAPQRFPFGWPSPGSDAPETAAPPAGLPPSTKAYLGDVSLARIGSGQRTRFMSATPPRPEEEALLANLPPVAREIAQGRFGAAAEVAATPNRSWTAATTGAPVVLALLEEGDGTAEVLLANLAAAHFQLAQQAAPQASEACASGGRFDSESAMRVFQAASRGVVQAVAALQRCRLLRRDAVPVSASVRRADDQGEESRDGPTAH